MTGIDLETWPLPESEMQQFFPEPTPYEDPGEFDESTVKLGNLTDPVKIKAKIGRAAMDWEVAREQGKELHNEMYLEACQKVREKACLDPRMSRIFGFVIKTGDTGGIVHLKPNPTQEEEEQLIEMLWARIMSSSQIVGWNILGFDLPYLISRTLLSELECPADITSIPRFSGQKMTGKGLQVQVFDLQAEFAKIQVNGRQFHSMESAARFFGIPGKHDLNDLLPWEACKEDEETARVYTKQDGDLLWQLGQKMQIIKTPWINHAA